MNAKVLRGRAGMAAVCVGLMLLAACGERTGRPPTSETTAVAAAAPELPEGWRWESFGGVQVGVPGGWGWTNASQRIDQWCVNVEQADREPAVGRPGVATAVGCPVLGEGTVPQQTSARRTGDIVGLGPAVDARPGNRGDRRTVVAAGVEIVIQTADPALRERIAETVHEVEVDAAGCHVDDPASVDPGRRPPAVGDLAGVTGVRSVAACKYAVRHAGDPSGTAPLLGSRRFEGPAAVDLVKALTAAPVGGGPNAPRTCMADYSHGDEVLILTVLHDAGTQRVKVTYSGCDHNGIDDGTTVRRLTREAMEPLTSQALTITGGFSGVMRGVLSFD